MRAAAPSLITGETGSPVVGDAGQGVPGAIFSLWRVARPIKGNLPKESETAAILARKYFCRTKAEPKFREQHMLSPSLSNSV